MEKFLVNFPRIGRNFSMNMSENFLGILPKLIPRNFHSETPIFIRKIPSYIRMEILLGTNAECTWNFSHGIIPTFFWIFSYRKKFKFLRKDFDPSYLRIGIRLS
jgi:hypothetical protein